MVYYLVPLFVLAMVSSLAMLLYVRHKGKAVRDPQEVAQGMFAIYGRLYEAMAEHVLRNRGELDYPTELRMADECHKFAYAVLVSCLNKLDGGFRQDRAWWPFMSRVVRAMAGSWAQVVAKYGVADAEPVSANELTRYLATWDVIIDKVDYNLANAAPQPLRPMLPTALFPDGPADGEDAAYQEAEALAQSLLQQAQEKLRSIW